MLSVALNVLSNSLDELPEELHEISNKTLIGVAKSRLENNEEFRQSVQINPIVIKIKNIFKRVVSLLSNLPI